MRYLPIALLALAIVACGDSTEPSPIVDSGTEPTPVVGTYALRSLNGLELPAVLATVGETQLWVMRGTVTVDRNDVFARSVTFRLVYRETDTLSYMVGERVGHDLIQSESGSWALEGSRLRLTFPGKPDLVGAFAEGSISFAETLRGAGGEGLAPADYPLSFVFRR